MLDVSVAYNRYKFLGHEFLTWLWFVIETRSDRLKDAEGAPVALVLGDRIVLENHRKEALETVTIKGSEAELEEGRLSVKKGAVVTELNLRLHQDDRTWRFDIKGESLSVSGLKAPESEGDKSDIEAVVLDKMDQYEKVLAFVRHLYREFIILRTSGEWDKKTLHSMRKWIASA